MPTINTLCESVIYEKQIKITTFRNYLSLFESRIKPFFKNKLVNEIKPKTINEFYLSLNDYSTANTCRSILKSAFNKAVLFEYINSTPMNIPIPFRKKQFEINPFSFDEALKIISLAPAPYKNLFGFLFFSGCRTGEALGLKWQNVDFINFKIKIDNQFTNGIEQTPKTKNSIRTIDMLPQTEKYLLNQKSLTPGEIYVFKNEFNKLMKCTSHLTNIWKQVLKDCNLEYRNLYQTRHSFASNMLSNGENVLWVSSMLGHKNINITLDKYSKFINNDSMNRKVTFLDKNCTLI